MFDLERFKNAQQQYGSYKTALEEIRQGRKRSHWIWYIFPQISGLGTSEMSRRFAISSLLEAKAYWDDITLKTRLNEITQALYAYNGQDMEDILGSIDAMKVRSCMTLFDYVDPDAIYSRVIRDCFDGEYCSKTRERVGKEYEWLRRDVREEYGLLHVNDRGLLEGGCEESGYNTKEEKIGTMISLFMKGERMEQMVSHYLWSKDITPYRCDGIHMALSSYISEITFQLCECREYECLRLVGLKLDSLYDMNVMELAKLFDRLLSELMKHPGAMKALDRFTEKSLLREADGMGK